MIAEEEDFGSEEEAEEQTNEDAEAVRAAGTAAPMLAKSFGSAVGSCEWCVGGVKPKPAPVEPLVKPDRARTPPALRVADASHQALAFGVEIEAKS